MPLFEVPVKGLGIRLVVADGEAAGSFRLVRVWAEGRQRAETRAIQSLIGAMAYMQTATKDMPPSAPRGHVRDFV